MNEYENLTLAEPESESSAMRLDELEDAPRLDELEDTPEQAGDSEDQEEQAPESPVDGQEPAPIGQRVSLRDGVFDPFISACDEKITRALRISRDTRENFIVTAKITFTCCGDGLYSVEHETGYQFEPIKVRGKGVLGEDLKITLDEDGNPIIPAEREHQMNFDEVAPGLTVTADSHGVVQKIVPDEPEEASPDRAGPSGECETLDCEFYDIEFPHNCRFDPLSQCFGAKYYADEEDVAKAVEEFHCQRPQVLESYQKIKEARTPDEC